MGIAGFTCLFFLGSLLAIIFGFVARSEIKKSGGMKRGSGMATAGIVLGFALLAILVLLAAVFIPISYVGVGPNRTVTKNVDSGAVSSVSASLAMDKGDLTVRGGAPRLMQGSFTYNASRWRPIVTYYTGGAGQPGAAGPTGVLRVRQGEAEWWRFWQWLRGKNRWDISFGGTVPIDMLVDQDWGSSDFDMLGVPLATFRVDSSAGDLTARLPGRMDLLREVSLDESAGRLMLAMVGEYPSMQRLTVRNSAGGLTVDLRGKWGRDLAGTIQNSAGAIRVKLPRDVGVYVTAEVSAGRIEAPRLQSMRDGVYVNQSYGKTPVTLRLDVRNSAGSVILDLD